MIWKASLRRPRARWTRTTTRPAWRPWSPMAVWTRRFRHEGDGGYEPAGEPDARGAEAGAEALDQRLHARFHGRDDPGRGRQDPGLPRPAAARHQGCRHLPARLQLRRYHRDRQA